VHVELVNNNSFGDFMELVVSIIDETQYSTRHVYKLNVYFILSWDLSAEQEVSVVWPVHASHQNEILRQYQVKKNVC
jgi:hypothetical protein